MSKYAQSLCGSCGRTSYFCKVHWKWNIHFRYEIHSLFLLELFIHAIRSIIDSYYSVLIYSVHTCILERFVAEKLVSCTYSFDFPLGQKKLPCSVLSLLVLSSNAKTSRRVCFWQCSCFELNDVILRPLIECYMNT